MRMWMCNPRILCRKHLLGEHVELHMFVGTLRKKKKIDGYLDNNLIEPLSIDERHNQLIEEMITRNMHHNSPLIFSSELLQYLPEDQINFKINQERALRDLLYRCDNCKKRYTELISGIH
jgi:hypothetical protein